MACEQFFRHSQNGFGDAAYPVGGEFFEVHGALRARVQAEILCEHRAGRGGEGAGAAETVVPIYYQLIIYGC
ncbi:hypothetical protein D9M69_691570 [compost metagenome]